MNNSHTRVAIIGGGSLGVSLLYHLTREGWTDITLIEKGELTSGSTWHAAGLVPNISQNMAIAQIHQYSIELYDKILPAETGDRSTFHRCGGLRIGFTELEEQWFRNMASRARKVGCRYEFIDKEEAKRLNPLMNFDNARVIVSTPDEGHVDPTSVVMPMSQLARKAGATIHRNTRVTAIRQLDSGEWEVATDKGMITAEHVVNAGGCFAPEVGAMVGVNVPIINLEHQYLVTEPHPEIEALAKEMPVCRDSYTESYIRQEAKGLLIGPYETYGSKPWALDGMDWSFDRELFEPDVERLMPFLDRCIELMPVFGEVGIHTVINGPIAHTPDDNPLIGPQAGLKNFWNYCGSSIGIAQGGMAKFMAQWMVHGQSEINLASLDSRRFGNWADKNFCITKAIEGYENMYTPASPTENRAHGRPARCSPLFTTLSLKGGVHGMIGGYEKPLWFATDAVRSDSMSWLHTESHSVVAEECNAVQNAAGVIDLCGASKYDVTGKDAAAFLDSLSANKLPAKDGRLGLTLMHGPNGGVMAEMSITRINDQHFYLNSGIASELRDMDWLQNNIGDYDVVVKNVTESIGAMLVTGPEARNILQQMTEDDISHKGLPWLTCKNVTLDSAKVRVIRVSYAGELGYELHMPVYQISSIYESLMRVGESYGLRDFGGYAFNSMRMEKAYRAYNHEFTEEVDGLDAGMERFVDLSRDFKGSQAITKNRDDQSRPGLVYLVFDDQLHSECFGNEAVYADDKLVGLTTSGGYGHRVGKSLAFAYVERNSMSPGTSLTVETTIGIRAAQVTADAVYDKDNARMRV